MNQSPKLTIDPASHTDFWEIEFPEAALSAEEFIYNFPNAAKNQSALNIALINHFITWNDYATWFMTKYYCQQIRTDLTLTELLQINQTYINTKAEDEAQNKPQVLKEKNNSLIKLSVWNEKNIVIGTAYEFNFNQKLNDIFVLCKLEYLNFIQQNHYTFDSQDDFWNQKIDSYKRNEQKTRQLFEAFCLLKIEDNRTQSVYMDEELEKEFSNSEVFNIDLSTHSFLKNYILNSNLKPGDETPLTIDCQLENFKVLDYSNAEIHKIFVAGIVVGFFIGFRLQQALSNSG